MIDLSHLKRVAGEATPGPWMQRGWHGVLECPTGDHVCFMGTGPVHERREMEQHDECVSKMVRDSDFISAFNPEVAKQLLEALECAVSELKHSASFNGHHYAPLRALGESAEDTLSHISALIGKGEGKERGRNECD